MRLLFFFAMGLLMTLPARAQERVRHVRVRVVDSSQLEIRYDLINTRPGDSIYLEVRSRLRGNLRILPNFVQGDVGKRITAGSERRIIWNALANGYSLNEDIRATILVKTGLPTAPPTPVEPAIATKPDAVPAKPAPTEPVAASDLDKPKRQEPSQQADPQAERPKPNEPAPVVTEKPQPRPTPAEPATPAPNRPDEPVAQPAAPTPVPAQPESPFMQRRRYGGPAWALVSVVAPGIGNIFVQRPKPKIGLRPLLTVGCYGLVLYGLRERENARDAFAIYEEQKNRLAGEPYYQTANAHHHRYFLATRGAIAVAAADVILTFMKGLRNSRLANEAQPTQSVTLRPGIQAGQPTAVVRYSF